MFRAKRTEIEKADLLGESLVGGASEAATLIVEDLRKRFAVGLREASSSQQFVIEIVVFYMHMVDRLAFQYLGPYRREVFADRLNIAVIKEFLCSRNKEVDAAEFAEHLKDAYNRRQREYAQYKDLIPMKDQPPKGTLFWEFSSILFGFMDDSNPATLVSLYLFTIDVSLELMKVMKIEEVLRN